MNLIDHLCCSSSGKLSALTVLFCCLMTVEASAASPGLPTSALDSLASDSLFSQDSLFMPSASLTRAGFRFATAAPLRPDAPARMLALQKLPENLRVRFEQKAGSQEWWMNKSELTYYADILSTKTTIRWQRGNFHQPILPQAIHGADLPARQYADLIERGFNQNFRINGKRWGTTNLIFRYRDNERDLPPGTAQRGTSERQVAQNLTAQLKYKVFLGGYWNLWLGFDQEDLNYRNLDTLFRQDTRFRSYYGQLGYANRKFRVGNVLRVLGPGIHYSINTRQDSGSQDMEEQRRITGFIEGRVLPTNRFVNLTFKLSEAWVEDTWSPLMYRGIVKFRDRDNFPMAVSMKIERDWTFPTLQTQFWRPESLPTLRPETHTRLGFSLSSRDIAGLIPSTIMGLDAKLNYDWYKDFHLWQPMNRAWWSPSNVEQVRSRTFSLRFRSKITFPGLFRVKLNTGWTRQVTWDQELNKDFQLIYTPRHRIQTKASLTWWRLFLNWNHQFSGKRYTDRNNTTALPSWQQHDLSLGVRFLSKQQKIELEGGVMNIGDRTYALIPGRFAAGRQYFGGIRWRLN